MFIFDAGRTGCVFIRYDHRNEIKYLLKIERNNGIIIRKKFYPEAYFMSPKVLASIITYRFSCTPASFII